MFTFTPKSESFLEFRKSTYYPPAPSFSRDMVDIRGGQTNIKERRKLQFKPGEGDALYGVFSWAWDVCLPVEVRAKVSLCSSALYPQLFSRFPCILIQLNLSLHFDSMKIEDQLALHEMAPPILSAPVSCIVFELQYFLCFFSFVLCCTFWLIPTMSF